MTASATLARQGEPSARFWDRIAPRYARQPIADEDAYKRKLRITQGYLRSDMEILEFGCGTGSTALVHAAHVRHIHAIDVSSKMLEIAREKAAERGVGNVTFEHAAIDTYEAPDASFDVVLGFSILHLVADKEAVIAKVRRLLKPGGVFVSSTACLGDGLKIFRLVGPVGRMLGLLPMLRVFTVRELESALIEGGFDIEQRWQPGRNKGVFIVAKRRPGR